MPWWKFDSDLLSHRPFADLRADLKIAFIAMLDLGASRWREPSWSIPVSGPDAVRVWGMATACHPARVRAGLEAFVSCGLAISQNGVVSVSERWRVSMPGNARTARWRNKQLGEMPRQPVDSQSTDSQISTLQTKDIRVLTRYIDIRQEQCIESGANSKSGALNENPPASPPRETADDLSLEAWSTPEPEAFVLTAPRSNGNGNHLAENARAIFALWQSLPGLEKHRSIQPHYDAITRAIQRWGYSSLNIAITRYSEIMTGDYWQYSWSIRDLISRKQGQWIERLISDDYREHFKKRRPDALDDHYRRLLGGA